jgi:hypothetical protein
MPASGQLAATAFVGALSRSRTGWLSSAAALSAGGSFTESNPLTPLRDSLVLSAGAPKGPCRVSPLPLEHVNASSLPELEVPSTEQGRTGSLSRVREVLLPPLASVGSRRTCSSTFENLD